jgi:type I restriction enzyme S subunit
MKADTYTATGIPVVRGNNLTGRPGFSGDFVFVSEATAARFARCLVRPGDLVFPHRGAIGEVGLVVEQGFERWMLSTSMMKLRPDPQRLDSRFAFYFFRSSLGRHQLLKNASQVGTPGIGQPLASLRACELALPPLRDQQAIAGVLGVLDDKIEQNRRTARALQRLARAIFRAWFVDFEPVKAKAAGATAFPSMPQPVFDALPTRFVDSDLGPVPEGWEVKTIGDVVTPKGGGTPSTKSPEFWDGGGHCWATPRDMSRLSHPVLLDTERHITDAGVKVISSGILPAGTVLMSSRAPVGYLAIAGVPTAINQGFIAMVCDGPVPPTYVLNWAFTSMDAIKAHASGTTFPEISKKNFRPLPVIVPTSEVIGAYQQTAEPLYELLTAFVREGERLGSLRDYLLPQLLSGAVKVRL